jgi:hypothetical protein
MTDEDEWNVCLKKIPHEYAVLIKTLVKASPLQDVSAMKQELLLKANTIMSELNERANKTKTFKISDFQKVDPPYGAGVDLDKYFRPTTRSNDFTPNKNAHKKKKVEPKTKKAPKKTRKVRKDKGVKRGPQKNRKKSKK